MSAVPHTPYEPYRWWNALLHGGCLISPARLEQHLADDGPLEWEGYRVERLRRASERSVAARSVGPWIETVLEDALLHRLEDWPSPVGEEWTVKGIAGESIRPRRLYAAESERPLPLFVCEGDRVGVGRGRRDVARAIEWLRKKDLDLALLTNGRQWRLIYAGPESDAFCESSADAWFESGGPAPALEALRRLLSVEALAGPLRQAVLDTRLGQSELSAALGERVRQAVELLVVASRAHIDPVLDDGTATLADVYTAGVRMVMRLVVLMFSEARELMPMTEGVYSRSYSMRHLFEVLEQEGRGQGGGDRLRHCRAAWPRIVALGRLVFEGSPHPSLPVPKYGGELFMAGDPDGTGVPRAIAALEQTGQGPTDLDVQRILTLITRAPVKIPGTTTVFPVDFSQLDTEYIGILYEGLLDYELRRAAVGEPQVILALGDQPILPLSRLEQMEDRQLADLLDKMKVKGGSTPAGEEESADEEDDPDDVEPDAADEGDEPEDDGENDPIVSEAEPGDERFAVRRAAHDWAKRAVIAGKKVRSPRAGASAATLRQYDNALEQAARGLIVDIRAPGDYYLVRFGGTRKGSGTFYTVPALAGPTVRRTLEPLIKDGEQPREPEEILKVKVCDPACGSGSFPLAALRTLTEALYESLLVHGWLREIEGRLEWAEPERPAPAWFRAALEDFPGINEPEGPSDPAGRAKARLRRLIVERCLYGVDINPLAVELTRVSLWVETMDPRLPFSFLDHKFKVGNSLVGCWFDRFQDYPLQAWNREGGDLAHGTSVHHTPKTWTRAIAACRDPVKAELAALIAGQREMFGPAVDPQGVHDDALSAYEGLHGLSGDPERQRVAYEALRASEGFVRLKRAFDAWSAVWFWPPDDLQEVPTPRVLAEAVHGEEGAPARRIVERLARRHRFFHWELEFPDVFTGPESGFDAVVGNPPWEIRKPNSKEWFSNLDPMYRSLGKQSAEGRQRELFRQDTKNERDWLEYVADLKAGSNWVKCSGDPFGRARIADEEDEFSGVSLARSAVENRSIFRAWEKRRSGRKGYSSTPHPFVSQGSADLNTYKMFLELGLALGHENGRLGMIVPSGVYTDRGSRDLRSRLLDECRWEWLYGFENREGIFAIHRSFKFCPLIIEKGGTTDTIKTAFMRRDVSEWEAAQPKSLLVSREQITRFSPRSRALLEVRDQRDVEILETMSAHGIPLGDDSPDGWGVKYATEFHMTNDSKLFPPREKWEAQGYAPDEYGHWLKGCWVPIRDVPPSRFESPGWVRSRDGQSVISIEDIEDVALPLYEGRMIGQFDFSQKGWVSGKGRTAVWRDIPWDAKVIEPQYLMGLRDYEWEVLEKHLHRVKRLEGKTVAQAERARLKNPATFREWRESRRDRVAFMDIASATNQRTMISAFLWDQPCGNSAAILQGGKRGVELCAVLNSFAVDFLARARCGGLHLNWFVAAELLVPPPSDVPEELAAHARALLLTNPTFAPKNEEGAPVVPAITRHERLRRECMIQATVALLFGLDREDLRWILRDCDHPTERLSDAFTSSLDPKGFWRVEKDSPPELRSTVLTLIAFDDLMQCVADRGREQGLSEFLGAGGAGGWGLPVALCLAEYGLGHDDRAKRTQPVDSRLGPRFYDWQLEQTPEESWSECRRHAENIRLIRRVGTQELAVAEQIAPYRPEPKPKTGSLFEGV